MHVKRGHKDFLASSVVPKQGTKIRGEEFDLLYTQESLVVGMREQ
jgi:hypothetical protein